MKLYTLGRSPNTIKVAAVIHYLGLPVEFQEVDLQKEEHRSVEFLAKNPNGTMPHLDDNGFQLWESQAIMIYLAQKKPESGLYPQEPAGQADVLRWLFWYSNHLSAAVRPYIYQRIVRPMMRGEAGDESIVAQAEPDFHKYMGILEAHLSKHTFLVGSRLTVADIALASGLMYHAPARLPMAEYPRTTAWLQGVTGQEFFQKATPPLPIPVKA